MSIFDGTTETAPQVTTDGTNPTESFIDKVVAAKGDTFRDPEALAKSVFNQDAHIKKLEEENKALQDLKLQSDFGNSLLEELRKQTPASGEPAATPGQTNAGGATEATPSQSPEDIKALVEEAIASREHTRSKEQNMAEADKVMRERFGDQAATELKKRAQELGVSNEYLAEVAGKSPTAFLRMIGEAPAPQTNQSPTSTVNTASLNQGSGKRDWAYYKELMKKDPKQYRSRAVQDQLDKDHAEQGDAFWGR